MKGLGQRNGRGPYSSIVKLISGASLMIVLAIMLACARRSPPPPIPIPVSPWGENYVYTYEIREQKAAGSVDATIAVVSPSYKAPETALSDPIFSRVAKGFANSMNVDVERTIVAKGMTVKGPFADIEEMTYPDKKGADLTLTPMVFVYTQTIESKWRTVRGRMGRMERDFEMRISGWVAFEMREPLSNEKIWIKKAELEDVLQKGIEVYTAVPFRTMVSEGRKYREVVEYKPGEPLYAGKTDAMANALKEMYPVIMEKFWSYINEEEILTLKAKGEEIRKLKRY